ncbi:MAG: hypothetical protein Q7S56_00550 [Nanoarchaeota archaeon]|nr:hypothetical protein [Nanoarchaeota archaeon]
MTKPPRNDAWGKASIEDFSSLCPTKDLRLERLASEMNTLLGEIGLSIANHNKTNRKAFYTKYATLIKEAISKKYSEGKLNDFKERYSRLLGLY